MKDSLPRFFRGFVFSGARRRIFLLLAAFIPAMLLAACLLRFLGSNAISLRAATYNVHYFQGGAPEVEKTIESMDADIVALQEVALHNGYSPVSGMAHRLGYSLVTSQPYVSYGGTQWVLAFLSRFPVLSRDEIRLGRSRRALRIVVDVEGRPVEFITLHLTPLAGPRSDSADVRCRSDDRKKEIQDLVRWAGPSERARLILGDFNFLRGLPGFWLDEYRMLLDAGYEDADGGWFPTNSDTFPLPESTRQSLAQSIPALLIPDAITLDYIFSSSLETLETWTIISAASDHYPLVGEFALQN
ncbi:MAG: endonuclease/exonuclease/phosphatase family protein [Leptospiraceae bacterium]|nr:endonuclease/exonuclease/phosphatase family protein [Leptospiraceae bacterium]